MTNNTTRPVRTRFAPSPTGPLHIGGARSALFGWLYARHMGGQFILRIEDTDQNRFVPEALGMITGGLSWLGIHWDEGPDIGGPHAPYFQSERKPLHQEWANWLVDHDKAYRCYCTPERLEQVSKEKEARKEPPGYDRHCRALSPAERAQNEAEGKSYVIRFKMPLDGETTVDDLVLGHVSFNNDTILDPVLLKSDGFPTYHLAHVVDDHFMEITHVTRANEWLPSLPLHAQLWQAFGWEMPFYAHLPVLLNPNGKGKLSKRHAGFSENGRQVLVLVSEFRDAGYLPEAVINFLCNIGWNFGDDREIFTVEEAIARFELKDVHPNNSSYPIEKLDWLNGEYIRAMDPTTLAPYLREPLEKAGYKLDDDLLLKIAGLVQTRIKTLPEVLKFAAPFFSENDQLDDAAVWQTPGPQDFTDIKGVNGAQVLDILRTVNDRLTALPDFSHEPLEAASRTLADELSLKPAILFSIIRNAVMGQTVTTPLFESMEVFGRAASLRRLELTIQRLSTER